MCRLTRWTVHGGSPPPRERGCSKLRRSPRSGPRCGARDAAARRATSFARPSTSPPPAERRRSSGGPATSCAWPARPRRDRVSGRDALTAGERRVAELAARGDTNREIAHELTVTVKAVEWHLHNVYSKLN